MFGNINMSQFGVGFNESQENMERKRVELAKAFEEFKAIQLAMHKCNDGSDTHTR